MLGAVTVTESGIVALALHNEVSLFQLSTWGNFPSQATIRFKPLEKSELPIQVKQGTHRVLGAPGPEGVEIRATVVRTDHDLPRAHGGRHCGCRQRRALALLPVHRHGAPEGAGVIRARDGITERACIRSRPSRSLCAIDQSIIPETRHGAATILLYRNGKLRDLTDGVSVDAQEVALLFLRIAKNGPFTAQRRLKRNARILHLVGVAHPRIMDVPETSTTPHLWIMLEESG
mmetsp:Transcript_22769/g.37478  ORF Transcript_22769/g.37478 Transcript_22769/m.37478 type:complete len:232 (+) Transcript_22769:38-733(+)